MTNTDTLPTLNTFLILLTSKITQHDAAAQKRAARKREFFNISALPQMFAAGEAVKRDVADVLMSSDPTDFARLRRSILERFNEIAPIRATIKQLDEYLKTGVKPRLK